MKALILSLAVMTMAATANTQASTEVRMQARGEVVLTSTLRVKKGREEKFMEAFERNIRPALMEASNISWSIEPSDEDPSIVVIKSRWISREALKQNLKSTVLGQLIARKAPITGSDLEKSGGKIFK